MEHELTDVELVKQVQSGKPNAMSQLYRRHRPAIYRYALSRVYDQQVAQDVVGEIFLRVVSYLPDYKITAVPFTAWLFRIAHNTLITIAQKESRFEQLPIEYAETPCFSAVTPDMQVEHQLNKEWIWSGLEQLDEAQRDVVVMRFLVGLSLKETAHALEKSVGAVKTLQHRGILALRVALNVKGKGVA